MDENSDTFANYEVDPNFDLGFESIRSRSNTWPCARIQPDPTSKPSKEGLSEESLDGSGVFEQIQSEGAQLPVKKGSARRNAWGNQSYADLITQAITSSTDQRLTLSEIYEWMVRNVPFFKDKGETNSSAGWKVRPSIHVQHIPDISNVVFVLVGSIYLSAYARVVMIVYHCPACTVGMISACTDSPRTIALRSATSPRATSRNTASSFVHKCVACHDECVIFR